jgi:eukaryotic-like serine/threonine-protein kinase
VTDKVEGRYLLLRELSVHEKVHTYRSTDTRTGDAVILRSLSVESEEDLEAFLRFQQEGAILTTLKHPNIFQLLATFMDGHTGYMVTEMVDGPSLAEILAHDRVLPSRAKNIAGQVASAMVYAHAKNIIHRDINPENIVVAPGDVVKLRAMSELGMARIVRAGATESSVAGLTIGQPVYLAPEQLTEQPIDFRVDIYSLGAVLYHLATGQPPFAGHDVTAVAREVANSLPLSPRQIDPYIPPDWEAVIGRAMARNPDDRFPSAAAMGRDIARLSEPGTPAPQVAADVLPETRDTVPCPRCGKAGAGAFCSACGIRLHLVP